MKRLFISAIALVALGSSATLLSSRAEAQGSTEKLTGATLKSTLSGMGYELKDLNTEVGKEKYEFSVTSGGFNIPIGAEVSASGRFVWLTVSLGNATEKLQSTALLKRNAGTQPFFFYISSKDVLMGGMALENRFLTAAHFKFAIEKVSSDIVASKDDWAQ